MAEYPFLKPYYPFPKDAVQFATDQADRHAGLMNGRALAIHFAPSVTDAERKLIMALRLMSISKPYKRFSTYDVTLLYLGRHAEWDSPSKVGSDNVLVEMSGFETENRKTEEFVITLFEMLVSRAAYYTFAVSADERRWTKIRTFLTASKFPVIKIEGPDIRKGLVSIKDEVSMPNAASDATSEKVQRVSLYAS